MNFWEQAESNAVEMKPNTATDDFWEQTESQVSTEKNHNVPSEIAYQLQVAEENERELRSAIGLIQRILSPSKSVRSDLEKRLEDLFSDFFTLVSAPEEDLPNEAETTMSMLEAKEDILKYIQFPEFGGKTTIGVGGGFSAGKSSLLNSILGEDILPTDISPTTAYPTYIGSLPSKQIFARNCFANTAELTIEDVKVLSHQFSAQYSLEMRHIIESIWLHSEACPFTKLCFLDTPGYSKGEHSETDKDTASRSLKLADAIIWVADCERGGIIESDVAFLTAASCKEKQILVVINKADLKPKSDIKDIVDGSKKTLSKAGINRYTVVAMSTHCPVDFATDAAEIRNFLKQHNKKNDPLITVKQKMASIFAEYINHHKDKIRQSKKDIVIAKSIIAECTFSDNPPKESTASIPSWYNPFSWEENHEESTDSQIIDQQQIEHWQQACRKKIAFSKDFTTNMKKFVKRFEELFEDIQATFPQ